MLEKIAVPLDGSPLSDRIVHLLRRLLVRSDASVTLVEVLNAELLRDERTAEQARAGARRHLEGVAEPLRADGAQVSTEVLAGDAAERLLVYSLERAPSLMVMATHGRTGIDRFVRGSVAERVLRESRTPLLMANPFALGEKDIRFRRILVPLDGSEEAAMVLPLVGEVARLYEAEVILHFTIPTAPPVAGLPPILMSDAEGLDVVRPFASALEGVRVELSTCPGDPASSILDVCERKGCDLIAMTTHGRSGWSRWIFGSVAEHVLRLARCPILVKRISGFMRPPASA